MLLAHVPRVCLLISVGSSWVPVLGPGFRGRLSVFFGGKPTANGPNQVPNCQVWAIWDRFRPKAAPETWPGDRCSSDLVQMFTSEAVSAQSFSSIHAVVRDRLYDSVFYCMRAGHACGSVRISIIWAMLEADDDPQLCLFVRVGPPPNRFFVFDLPQVRFVASRPLHRWVSCERFATVGSPTVLGTATP
jgi:hypothetical protein